MFDLRLRILLGCALALYSTTGSLAAPHTPSNTLRRNHESHVSTSLDEGPGPEKSCTSLLTLPTLTPRQYVKIHGEGFPGVGETEAPESGGDLFGRSQTNCLG
ncbi:unnamed protein product [Peniophora sp. CBMAI 1063]|nr:unnamed protein product [Peniophora sp. CBMAI 1063]